MQDITLPTLASIHIYRMFGSETDKLRQRVWEVILSKKSHIKQGSIRLCYRDMDRNDYSPWLWCYRLKCPL
jgi:hypothetical protein